VVLVLTQVVVWSVHDVNVWYLSMAHNRGHGNVVYLFIRFINLTY
jgi:hypothetical protein